MKSLKQIFDLHIESLMSELTEEVAKRGGQVEVGEDIKFSFGKIHVSYIGLLRDIFSDTPSLEIAYRQLGEWKFVPLSRLQLNEIAELIWTIKE